MKLKILITLLLLIIINIVSAQKNIRISGFMIDKTTGEALINGTIYNTETLKGTTSNQFGYYSFSTPKANHIEVMYTYVGYKPAKIQIDCMKDTLLMVSLEKGLEIGEVTVSCDNEMIEMEQARTGRIDMDAKLAQKLPSLFGEPDLSRALQLMPGVQGGKEGTGGLFVRGGSSDQNLILLDNMPIFNANHIGGFVSVFNPSAINHLSLYKAGFPVKFGGRLSSILDIQMKNGNLQERSGGYSLGTLTGSAYLEGPIRKDTSSFLISYRRTIFDLLLSTYNHLTTNGESDGGYSLWDINAKYNCKLNNRKRLQISFYKGRDVLFRKNTSSAEYENIISKSYYKNYWGNSIVSARLNCNYNTKTYANYVWGISTYKYAIQNSINTQKDNFTGESNRIFSSGLSQYIFQANFETATNLIHDFSYGLNASLHYFCPAKNEYSKKENQLLVSNSGWGISKINTPEISIYFSDRLVLIENLNVDIGARLSSFWIEKKRKSILEPRFVANYRFKKNSSLKLSYARMSQSIHLVSSNDQAFPSDFWFPSSQNIEPEISSQWSLGSFHSIRKNHNYQLTFDVFYKQMKNLLEQKSTGLFLNENSNWEQDIETGGIGKAYGVEFLLEKKTGITTGWLAYTLSKNERNFPSVNQGKWYPYRYDRRHELTLVINHRFTKSLSFHANWIFMSGEALNLPSYKYLINTQQLSSYNPNLEPYNEAHYYNGKNGFRTPAYHRLDFNLSITKPKYKGEATWSLGLYNAYNSTNAFYYYFAKNNQGKIKLHALTLFPIMPSINYSYKF